ncbi:MAG: SIMPL domain-containing protein [Desulfobulbaceae bacterium]|nr:SIMPL domain-containing protein [Desulfobulbaceae bacterium]
MADEKTSGGLFFLGFFLCLAIILSSWLMSRALYSIKAAERYVTVKGLAEREVDADLVIWPVSFFETGNDLAMLHETINSKQQAVRLFLTENGIRQEEISVNPPVITDFEARKYDSGTVKRENRYLAQMIFTVRSSNLPLVRSIMGRSSDLVRQDIVLAGDDYQNQPEYLFTGLNSIKPAMIEEATKNARLAAEQFARDSGSSVGTIRNARQGFFTITDRDSNTPYRKIIRVVTSVDYFLLH